VRKEAVSAHFKLSSTDLPGGIKRNCEHFNQRFQVPSKHKAITVTTKG